MWAGYLDPAVARPDADLPCPTCGAVVRASRLESHLTRVHGGVPAFEPEAPIVGRDRRITRIFVVLLGLGALAAALLIGQGHTLTDRNVSIAAGIAFGLLSLIVLAELGAFRASLVVSDAGVTHRWALGLMRRVVARPERLESGSWTRRVPSAVVRDDEVNAHEEVKSGCYLRVGSLRIGGRRAGSTVGRWSSAGLRRGPRLRGVDVILDRQGLLALEWALAAQGWLVPAGGVERGERG